MVTQAPTLRMSDRRNVGLLVLKVKEAEGLKKMDMLGKADPFVEAYTQAHQMEKTVRWSLAHGTISHVFSISNLACTFSI